jgi:hypothetical protein
MKKLLPLLLLLLCALSVRAQDASGSLFPDGSKAAPTPSPEPEARLDQRNQEFTDSLTARAALLAAYQFNSKLSVFAPLASDPIACATAYKGVAYFNTGTGAVKICDGSTWGTGGLGATAGGSTTQVQYNNAGALAGNSGFTFTAPTLNISGATTTGPDVEVSVTGDTTARVAIGMNTADVPRLSMGPGNAVRDTFLSGQGRPTGASARPTRASPVAQTLSVQNVVAGTSNTAGANFTLNASRGTGTGAGGSIVFKTAAAGSTGSSQNSLATALTLAPDLSAAFVGSVGVGFGGATPPSGPTLSVASTISTSPRGIASMQFSTDTAGARLGFFKARGTPASPATVVVGDTLGRLMFRGYVGATNAYVESASIETVSAGTVADTSTGRLPSQLVFATSTDASPSVLTTALTLDETQRATFAGDTKVAVGKKSYWMNLDTDASNYERGFVRWNSNILEIGDEAAGTGSTRVVNLVANSELQLQGNGIRIRPQNSTTTAWIFNSSGNLVAQSGVQLQLDKTFTAAGTAGAQTINKQTFSVNFAATATSLVVTNSLIATTTGLTCTVNTNDATMKTVAAVPASGSVTLFANAAATAETRVTCNAWN